MVSNIMQIAQTVQTFLVWDSVLRVAVLCSMCSLTYNFSEVEKFIQANTQELAKDKWLCPLSGKKFKGPEFVRKHIFNKHGEKVDEVKKEVSVMNDS